MPASYPIHIAEEYAVAGGFLAWTGREFGAALPMAAFIAWNVFAFGLLCLGAWLVTRDTKYRWIEIAVAIAFAGNALAHLVASALTWSYSPGLATGVLLWVPLSIARGVPAFRASGARGRRAGVLVGLAAVIVPLAVLGAELRRAAISGEPHSGRRVESARHDPGRVQMGEPRRPLRGRHGAHEGFRIRTGLSLEARGGLRAEDGKRDPRCALL